MVHVSTHGLTLASCVHGPSLDSQLRRRTGMWGSTPRANTAVEVHRLANERRAFTSAQRYGFLAAVGTSVRLFKTRHLPSEWERLLFASCAPRAEKCRGFSPCRFPVGCQPLGHSPPAAEEDALCAGRSARRNLPARWPSSDVCPFRYRDHG